MKCDKPIQLKSGLVVPCGKCVLCLSHRRDEWSARLQLHTECYDTMPFFVTLTYDPEYVVYADGGYTLVKDHVRLFIKRLKDKFNLYNTDFAYFGCGEYGDKGDPALDRPHYHVLFFGFPRLEEAYKRGGFAADDFIYNEWKLGFAQVGRAEWSGIHYVTKYVLKYLDDDYQGKEKPFIFYTRGIGNKWFESPECKYLKKRILEFQKSYFNFNDVALDYSSPEALRDSCRDSLVRIDKHFPRLVCTLPQGNKVPLPRYYRKKLIGSFEHFQDNPFWIREFVKEIYDSTNYSLEHMDYDREAQVSYQRQIIEFAKNRIYRRLILKQSSKK